MGIFIYGHIRRHQLKSTQKEGKVQWDLGPTNTQTLFSSSQETIPCVQCMRHVCCWDWKEGNENALVNLPALPWDLRKKIGKWARKYSRDMRNKRKCALVALGNKKLNIFEKLMELSFGICDDKYQMFPFNLGALFSPPKFICIEVNAHLKLCWLWLNLARYDLRG